MTSRNVYANTRETGLTIDFFRNAVEKPRFAQLAAPFFTATEPVEELTDKGCFVRLIVRFSPATHPGALRRVFENPRVTVGYFTDAKFHTKLYIVDDFAIVGSANLTGSGLWSNCELSVLLRRDRDEAFSQLPGIFEGIWKDAVQLNEEALRAYEEAFGQWRRPPEEDAFENFILRFVGKAPLKSVVSGGKRRTKELNAILRLRRKYDEILVPAHDEILEVAKANGFGRPEFAGQDPRIEMGKFLGWLRSTQGSKDSWRKTSLLSNRKQRAERIAGHVRTWQSADDSVQREMRHADAEIENIANIRTYLCDPKRLSKLDFDELFRHMTGCHAFRGWSRYASRSYGEDLSSLKRLRNQFQAENRKEEVVRTLNHLLSGSGDAIERACECVHGSYKLRCFGEASVMELLAWGDSKRPPLNNRSIQAIRLLGFDVEHLVAGKLRA